MLFKRPIARPTSPIDYPPGVFVETEKGYFYIAAPGKRFRCVTKRVLDSWAPPRVALSSEAACANFKITAKLKFRNGSLLQSVGDGRLWYISEGKRRHLQSPEAWDKIGAVDTASSYRTTIRVSTAEIELHEEGEPLV